MISAGSKRGQVTQNCFGKAKRCIYVKLLTGLLRTCTPLNLIPEICKSIYFSLAAHLNLGIVLADMGHKEEAVEVHVMFLFCSVCH